MGCNSSAEAKDTSKRPAAVPGRTVVGSWLKTKEDLKEFPLFPEGADKSVLAKYLSEDIWNEYKDKVDEQGVDFRTCVFSGCKNTDSSIGVYAGSHSSYTAFNKLFDQVIQDYHGHAPDAQHVSDMDAETLDAPALPEDEAAMIVSTRIRVGRNLADYPLGPGITNDQRAEIMKKVIQACDTFEGDLKGKFYALDSLTPEENKQLIEDHFLFK